MKIKSIFCHSFEKYGKIVTGYDVRKLLDVLTEETVKPMNSVIYEPVLESLQNQVVIKKIKNGIYGGQNIEAGYCNGSNTKLNCLEYHRGSEVNIPKDPIVLLVASLQNVCQGKINTSHVEAFYVPAETIVQLYETTLHYAPCNGITNDYKVLETGFRVVIILPDKTNTEKPIDDAVTPEDQYLWANNKWLLAHPDSNEAKQGAWIGLSGPNIDIVCKKQKKR